MQLELDIWAALLVLTSAAGHKMLPSDAIPNPIHISTLIVLGLQSICGDARCLSASGDPSATSLASFCSNPIRSSDLDRFSYFSVPPVWLSLSIRWLDYQNLQYKSKIYAAICIRPYCHFVYFYVFALSNSSAGDRSTPSVAYIGHYRCKKRFKGEVEYIDACS